MNNQKTKKRVLKKGVEKVFSTIVAIWFFWIMTTIDTIDNPFNEIKSYLIITGILTILALFSFIMLMKYSNFDKFLTENENNIKSIKIEVVKELKRNFKDMKTQLEKRETKLIIKDKLENAFNLNSKIDKRFA